MPLKNQIRLAIALGVLSLVAGLVGHLALTDIYPQDCFACHAESDLSLEWNTLRLSAVIFLIFIFHTLITLRNVLKSI
jgi:hypothetical protein